MSEQESKQQILKSTGILGSVQVMNILVGVIRVKILAVLLGPVGVGIAGIYQMIIATVSSATGFGLNFSGVRDVAAAVASKDEDRVARVVLIIRRWAFFAGLVGTLITLIFCKLLSQISFGNESYAPGVAMLSIALLLTSTTGAMNAILQGTRRINDMAKANILAAVMGLVGGAIIYYVWGLDGIVPSLLVSFFFLQGFAWYFARKVKTKPVSLSIKDTYLGGLSMVKLGFFMVITIFLNSGFMYVARYFIIQKGGLESVGQFIAAYTISKIYISAIFAAMSADYFPRLSGLQNDNVAVAKLVNEQTEIALLLTIPVIVGMISFIELIVSAFYSKAFHGTADILSWQLLGDFVKVMGYPLGFVLLAKSKGKLVIITELIWNIVFLGLIYFGWDMFGIEISGIAFLIAYIVNVLVVFFIVKKSINFNWSVNMWAYVGFFLPLLVLAFCNFYLFNQAWQQYVFGSLLTMVAALFSLYHLKKIIDLHAVMQKFKLTFAVLFKR